MHTTYASMKILEQPATLGNYQTLGKYFVSMICIETKYMETVWRVILLWRFYSTINMEIVW